MQNPNRYLKPELRNSQLNRFNISVFGNMTAKTNGKPTSWKQTFLRPCESSLAELAEQFQVHPNQITKWKKQLLSGAQDVFESGTGRQNEQDANVQELHAKIGELTMEGFFIQSAGRRSVKERISMVKPSLVFPVTKQCKLLGVNRSSVYYQPRKASDADLVLMGHIDKIHMARPYKGSRRIRDELEDIGIFVNRKRIQRLMRQMGITALYPRKCTSVPGQGHKVYPYLLKDLTVNRSNQAWATDITYIPMAKGFLYLVAIMDWHSRKVLAWRLSNTLDTDFCIEALNDALKSYKTPEIFNTDQGAQFTSTEFTSVLKANNIAISMTGKGRWRDNVFVERLWRSLKYEEVYLKAYTSVPDARESISRWFETYNRERRHQALQRKTPDTIYTLGLAENTAA